MMDCHKKYNIPPCYVVVRKISLEEISRLSISPFYIASKCRLCEKIVYYGPKCSSCEASYHYDCALSVKNCCETTVLPLEENVTSRCPKCKKNVAFGPHCSLCKSKFHSNCITPYDQCCQLNLCEFRSQHDCGICLGVVDFGPKCPLCKIVYHTKCIGDVFKCCGIKFTHDIDINYRCSKCRGKLALGSPMCLFCGKLTHNHCLTQSRKCCGKRVPLEIFVLPSFKYMIHYYMQFVRRRNGHRKMEKPRVAPPHTLRSIKNSPIKKQHIRERVKQRSISSQTNSLDGIAIVDVKTELEEKELDISDSPPMLEREYSIEQYTSGPSSSIMTPESTDSDDTLKNLFDFLYNMVKKFPPPLQTQVKIELFKTVTEAEMKLKYNTIQNNIL